MKSLWTPPNIFKEITTCGIFSQTLQELFICCPAVWDCNITGITITKLQPFPRTVYEIQKWANNMNIFCGQLMIWWYSTKLHFKEHYRENEKNNWCVLYDVLFEVTFLSTIKVFISAVQSHKYRLCLANSGWTDNYRLWVTGFSGKIGSIL